MSGLTKWCTVLLVLLAMIGCKEQPKTVQIRILHTSDMHGNVYPMDMVRNTEGKGGLARFATALEQIRKESPNLLLLDGGDTFQGQPPAYYYNYIDTVDSNIMVQAMNYLKYDAASVGNHDIEAGHSVYDRAVKESNFPYLAANAIDVKTDKPYFAPYKTFVFDGIKVAVMGMITPAIPEWVPAKQWEGIRFDDVIKSAEYWVPRIREKAQPDIFVALIHSGVDNDNPRYVENAARMLATQVPGLDMVLCGHDHKTALEWVKNTQGDSVLIIDPANNVNYVSDVNISITRQGKKILNKKITAELLDVNLYEPDSLFMKTFAPQREKVMAFLDRKVGQMTAPVLATDALFGTSTYMDVVHQSQLSMMDADISFAAPLMMSAKLAAGELSVRDLFQFFPFSNMLYAMDLTGAEIKGYLEYSYGRWAATMKNPNDHLLLFRPDAKLGDKYKTASPTFNYSAAQGLDYTVDVTKPEGERVKILRLSNGEPFELTKHYRVAVNSYRAGGAGGLLTKGAGIPVEELPNRVLAISEGDQLMCLIRYFEKVGSVKPVNPNNWQFVPRDWVQKAKVRDLEFFRAR